MKSILIISFMFYLASCVHGQAPRMERKIKVWNGAPEENGICRLSSDQLRKTLNLPWSTRTVKRFHQGFIGLECIQANEPQFKNYSCMTFEDLGVIYGYIEKLIYSCKEWKK